MKRKLLFVFLALVVMVNVVAFNHAYQFSHFDTQQTKKTIRPEDLSILKKLQVLVTGIKNPKPINESRPDRDHDILKINTHHGYTLNAWFLKVAESKGTVLLFHGYSGKKSDLLTEASAFNTLGYNAVLVDFYGSGDSDGSETSIGYYEALDVKHVYNYVAGLGEKNIILYGPSMGAVAIFNAVANHDVNPTALVVECPYGKLLTTVKNRFDIMGVPSLGFAELLVFWGGVQNGYWGFSMNTIEFAKSVQTPTLIMHGKEDKRANLNEIKEIYKNLSGTKKLKIFEAVEHEAYSERYPEAWSNEIESFLRAIDTINRPRDTYAYD